MPEARSVLIAASILGSIIEFSCELQPRSSLLKVTGSPTFTMPYFSVSQNQLSQVGFSV
jgi:hypothetical protein